MEIIICDANELECLQIERYIDHYFQSVDLNVHIRFCNDRLTLFGELKKKTADVIIVAQEGVAGLDTITGLNLESSKIIWLSGLDFGVQAYRLNVSYFNMFPITQEKMEHGLYNTGLGRISK